MGIDRPSPETGFSSTEVQVETEGGGISVERAMQEIVREEEGSPTLEIGDVSKGQLQALFSDMKAGEKAALAVIRCWNKDAASIKEVVQRLAELKTNFPELQGVMFSINGNEKGDKRDPDNRSFTAKAIEELIESGQAPEGLRVSALVVDGYTWSAGLNAPAALSARLAESAGLDAKNLSILNQSFDVTFPPELGEAFSKTVQEEKPVATVREDATVQVTGERTTTYADIVRILIQQGADAEIDTKDLTTIGDLGRNTGSLYSLRDIIDLGGFNPKTNEMGGMEDHEFMARLLVDKLREGSPASLRQATEVLKALRHPAGYADSAWVGMDPDKAAQKRENENQANRRIIDSLTERMKQETPEATRLSPNEQDFSFAA